MSLAQCKTALIPLLTHWSYCSLALSHLNNDVIAFVLSADRISWLMKNRSWIYCPGHQQSSITCTRDYYTIVCFMTYDRRSTLCSWPELRYASWYTYHLYCAQWRDLAASAVEYNMITIWNWKASLMIVPLWGEFTGIWYFFTVFEQRMTSF